MGPKQPYQPRWVAMLKDEHEKKMSAALAGAVKEAFWGYMDWDSDSFAGKVHPLIFVILELDRDLSGPSEA